MDKEQVIEVLEKRNRDAFDNAYHRSEHKEILQAIDIINRLVPPDKFDDDQISIKHYEEVVEIIKKYKKGVDRVLETLGHKDGNYAVGEGNIKDACIELENMCEGKFLSV